MGERLPQVIRSTDLIYIFGAAIWVNVVSSYLGSDIGVWGLVLFGLTFALIPAEIYTTAVWQRVALMFDNNPSDDSKQAAMLAAMDIARVFCLTMTFAFFSVAVDVVTSNEIAVSLASLQYYLFFLGLFLLINRLWNQVNFDRIQTHDGAGETRKMAYDLLFDRYYEEYKKGDDRPQKAIYLALVRAFEWVNRALFLVLFPLVGLALVVVSFFVASNESVRQAVLSYLGVASVAVFAGQVGLKLLQIVCVSMMITDLNHERKTSHDTAQAT